MEDLFWYGWVVLLSNLSKVSDCLDHGLFTAKFNTYGVSPSALRLIQDYLSNWTKEQGLLINIVLGQKYYLGFHKGQFFIHSFLTFSWQILFLVRKGRDTENYAEDSTNFIVEENNENVIASLEEASKALRGWFKHNRLKPAPAIFFYFLFSHQMIALQKL